MNKTARAAVGLAASLVLGSALAGCSSSPSWMPSLSSSPEAPKVACDGRPAWCLTVANEVTYDTGVYVDGQRVATAPAQGSVKVPLAAGQSHQVNYCREVRVNKELFGLISEGKMLCSKPTAMTLDGNQTKIVYDGNTMVY